MIDLISVDNMRQSDAATIASGIPGTVLMQRAAQGIFDSTDRWSTAGRINIVTGSGNNGGDGYALASILADNNLPVSILTLSAKATEDGAYYRDICISKGVDIRPFTGDLTADCGIIVDCLLGTGFKGEVRENYLAAIDAVNSCHKRGCFVISADINSGMNGDTGEFSCAVESDLTVSIGYIKKGQITPSALSVTGSLAVADIGIELVNKEDTVDENKYGINVITLRRSVSPEQNNHLQKELPHT